MRLTRVSSKIGKMNSPELFAALVLPPYLAESPIGSLFALRFPTASGTSLRIHAKTCSPDKGWSGGGGGEEVKSPVSVSGSLATPHHLFLRKNSTTCVNSTQETLDVAAHKALKSCLLAKGILQCVLNNFQNVCVCVLRICAKCGR